MMTTEDRAFSANLFCRVWLTALATLAITLTMMLPLASTAFAEACSGAPSALEVLDPGDDGDSGLGGTGLGSETRARSDRAAGRAQDRGGEDESGVGGTGRAPRAAREDESGIGGTGLHGPVTRTDRFCVNGVGIDVPAQLTLEGSGGVAAAHALAVGQIVFVDAQRTDDGLVARRIALADAYVGQIEVAQIGSVDGSGGSIVVSGQPVKVPRDVARGPGLGAQPLEPGGWLTVHGLPNARGEIVATRLEAARPGEVRRGESDGNQRLADWLRDVQDLDYVSLEGFVTGSRERPRVSGFALGFAAQDTRELRVRPGARVRVGGRPEGRETLRIALPPRPGSTLPPPRSKQPPAVRPEADKLPPHPQPAPDITPQAPPRPTRRPENTLPRKPSVRPDIQRPTSVRPTIDRPTRRDVLPRR